MAGTSKDRILLVLVCVVTLTPLVTIATENGTTVHPSTADNTSHSSTGSNQSRVINQGQPAVTDHHGNIDHHGDYNTTSGTSGHQENKGHQGEEHHSHGIHLVSINLEHVKYPLVFSLVVILAGLSKIGFHHADFLSSKVPESCVLILLGVVVGGILLGTGIGDKLDFFAPHEFFLFLLPPIILESAYSLHERTFFENLGSILMCAVFGTVLACFLIGLSLIGLYKAGAMEDINCTPVQILVFSALIVAVDPVAVLAVFQEVGVNKVLYFIVFGESLLNDGVTVVLYNVMQAYNRMDGIPADQIVMGILKFLVVCGCGILIGVFLGLLSSFVTRYTNSVKVVEPIVIFGFAYLSYILAEMFHFSGIISIIACGLAQAQYAFLNVTNKSRVAIKFFAKVISSTSEIIIFLFLGLKIVHPHHVWVTGFTLWTTFFCIFYRFIIVFGMSLAINRFDSNRVRKIGLDEMFMISYGGLRGAVCFSLVALLDEKEFPPPMKNMFVTTTLFVILFTVFIQGGTIKFLVKKLRVRLADTSKEMILYQELNQHVTDHLMAGIEQVVGYEGKFYLREKFEHFDNRFLRPLLLRDCTKNSEMEELSMYYEKLVMKEHYKNLQLCGASKLPHVRSDLRAIDSSACLKDMAEDGDNEVLKRREKRLVRSLSTTSQKDQNWDVKKVFREALLSNKHTGHIKYHDKNMAFSQRRNLVGHLRKKHKQNSQLLTMRSQSTSRAPAERTLSWSEEDTDLCQRRTSDVKVAHQYGNRAYTVDLSSSLGSPRTSKMNSLEDTVFEMDEFKDVEKDKEQADPLLPGNENQNSSRRVKFFTRQSETDETREKEKTAENRSFTAGIEDRRPSAHAGHILRQDALTEADLGSNTQEKSPDIGSAKRSQ